MKNTASLGAESLMYPSVDQKALIERQSTQYEDALRTSGEKKVWWVVEADEKDDVGLPVGSLLAAGCMDFKSSKAPLDVRPKLPFVAGINVELRDKLLKRLGEWKEMLRLRGPYICEDASCDTPNLARASES